MDSTPVHQRDSRADGLDASAAAMLLRMRAHDGRAAQPSAACIPVTWKRSLLGHGRYSPVLHDTAHCQSVTFLDSQECCRVRQMGSCACLARFAHAQFAWNMIRTIDSCGAHINAMWLNKTLEMYRNRHPKVIGSKVCSQRLLYSSRNPCRILIGSGLIRAGGSIGLVDPRFVGTGQHGFRRPSAEPPTS